MAEELLVTQGAGTTREVAVGFSVRFGGRHPVVIAGPCSVESEEQILETAEAVRAAGAHMLRGGAFKPRTSPYSFQGLGAEGLRLLALARERTGLPVVTEVMDDADVPIVAEHADMLQIGARSMQNFALLKAAGRSGRPVLLKRGAAATLGEWLHAAEYVLAEGNDQVVLCERGIRTFEPYTRNTLDLASAVAAKHRTSLPVIADPSHGSGRRALVAPLAKAAIASGLDGVMVEVHPDPDASISDSEQSISTQDFRLLMRELRVAPQIEDVAQLRGAIDELDQAMLDLLLQRMELSDRVGRAKHGKGLEVQQLARERAIIEAVAARAGDALPTDAVRSIWGAIFAHSRRRQEVYAGDLEQSL